MSRIEFVNLGEVLAGIKARTEKLNQIPRVARQMGVLALNEIHPLTAKKSNTWDNSIHAEVHELGAFKWELWVGSKGAFAANGYNYGARQERLAHPIEIGWGRAQGPMSDLWNAKMHGALSRSVAGSISESFEFENMAGF